MKSADPIVEIVITNHNYGDYVRDAVESALAQTRSGCLVTVVDDGSTDHSPKVIDEYARRVRVIHKEHGGQASAVNAAWERVRGDLIIFLDADDMLDADIAQRVVQAFDDCLDVGKVQYRLEYVDASGRPMNKFVPRSGQALPNGDVRSAVLEHGDDIPWPPMSGNAYSRTVLERILPIPEADYLIVGADIYLINMAALYGPVASLDRSGGRYRIHSRNAYFHSGPDVDRLATMVELTERTHAHLHRQARAIGLDVPPRGVGYGSLTFAANVMALHSLKPDRGILPDRSTVALAANGITASIRRSDQALGVRLTYASWFLMTGILPRPLARLLARWAYTWMRQI
jgi:hypothetical protein